jgi:hypothetical protein
MIIKKYNESVNNITKTKKETLTYYNLFELLRGLEKERPGIKDRIWKWMLEERDAAFEPYNGRISHINLFYFGVGPEYQIKDVPEEEIEHSRSIHPEAFKKGTKEESLRLDLNLIWATYADELDNKTSMLNSSIEMFAVLVSW